MAMIRSRHDGIAWYTAHFSRIGWRALCCLCSIALLGACSVERTTPASRFYHSLTTRYNINYNAQRAYDDAYDAWLRSLTEGYSRQIPVDPIAYAVRHASGTPRGAFDVVIAKMQKAIRLHSLRHKPARKSGWRDNPQAVADQSKQEHNDALRHSWQLLGQAYLYNGDAEQALATFAYMTRLYDSERETRDRALLWQLHCITLLGREAEGRQLLMQIDTTDHERVSAVEEIYHLALGEYYLALGERTRALPYIEEAVYHVTHRVQRARLYYLLGQLYSAEGVDHTADALHAYTRVLRLSPPATLEFASRLRRAELSPQGAISIRQGLQALARRGKYASERDQIYYALGRHALAQGDTTEAMKAFVLSSTLSQSRGEDYALSLIAQGQVHLSRYQWLDAYRAYNRAMPALPKVLASYSDHRAIAEGLAKLQPWAQVVHEGDSLLRLARAPELERTRVIDSIIEEKRRLLIEAERSRQRDSIVQASQMISLGAPSSRIASSSQSSMPRTTGDTRYYFYNTSLLAQGRDAFRQQWGARPLADHWRRYSALRDHRDVALPMPTTESTKAPRPSPDAEDPQLQPSYYLDRLPLEPDAQRQLELSIEHAMAQMGQTLADQLDLSLPATHVWREQIARFPEGPHHEQSLYRLYMTSLRLGDTIEAERVRQHYIARYPATPLASQLATGDYIDRLRTADSLASALYTSTYEAYTRGDLEGVHRGAEAMRTEHPDSEHLPRLMLLSAMAYAIEGEDVAFARTLGEITTMPRAQEDIKAFAHELLSSLAQGKRLSGQASHGIDWSKVHATALAEAEASAILFVNEADTARLSLLVYAPRATMSQSDFVYALTLYGFTQYTQEGLRLGVLTSSTYHLASISGFGSRATAEHYRQGLQRDLSLPALPIGETNLAKIVGDDSFEAYLAHWQRHETIVEPIPSLPTPVAPLPPASPQVDTLEPLPAVDVAPEGERQHSEVSYEQVQQMAKQRRKAEEAERRARAKAKEAERKRKLREQREKLKAKERDRREREQARARERRDRERLR